MHRSGLGHLTTQQQCHSDQQFLGAQTVRQARSAWQSFGPKVDSSLGTAQTAKLQNETMERTQSHCLSWCVIQRLSPLNDPIAHPAIASGAALLAIRLKRAFGAEGWVAVWL